jgi:hypothetical protein
VPVVLRVKLKAAAPGVAGQYGWDEVNVIKVLKNTSDYQFGATVQVAWKVQKAGGVPRDECTVYLEPFPHFQPPDPQRYWQLCNDGDAHAAISHVAAAAKLRKSPR